MHRLRQQPAVLGAAQVRGGLGSPGRGGRYTCASSAGGPGVPAAACRGRRRTVALVVLSLRSSCASLVTCGRARGGRARPARKARACSARAAGGEQAGPTWHSERRRQQDAGGALSMPINIPRAPEGAGPTHRFQLLGHGGRVELGLLLHAGLERVGGDGALALQAPAAAFRGAPMRAGWSPRSHALTSQTRAAADRAPPLRAPPWPSAAPSGATSFGAASSLAPPHLVVQEGPPLLQALAAASFEGGRAAAALSAGVFAIPNSGRESGRQPAPTQLQACVRQRGGGAHP